MMMPNYVDNTIVLDGVGSNDLLEGLYTDDCGEFDFERVIPCPTDLNQLANDKRDLNKILNVSITACIIAYLCQSQPTLLKTTPTFPSTTPGTTRLKIAASSNGQLLVKVSVAMLAEATI